MNKDSTNNIFRPSILSIRNEEETKMKKSDTAGSLSETLSSMSMGEQINRDDLKKAATKAKNLEEIMEEDNKGFHGEGGRRTEQEEQLNFLKMRLLETEIAAREAETEKIRKRSKPMNSKQQLFSGKESENVKDWLFITNLNLETAEVNEELKTVTAAGYLRENALQVYRQATEETELTWEKFKELLIKKFYKKDTNVDLIKKLYELKQTDSLTKYIEQFTYLMNQTSNIQENIKIHMFRNGTEKQIEAEIAYRNPGTLDEAIEIAEAYQRSFGSKTAKTQQTAYYSTHYRTQQNNQNSNTRRRDGNCHYCGIYGHFEADCYKKKKEGNTSQRNSNNQNQNR